VVVAARVVGLVVEPAAVQAGALAPVASDRWASI